MKKAPPLPIPRWIATKREGLALEPEVIDSFIDGAATGKIPDYQVAAMLMAIVFQGLSEAELVRWTKAMIASGDTLSLKSVKGRKIDKHSTGGVGDKLSLTLAPAVAACGVKVPMLAGRALGHTGGTLDKLEAIKGFNVSLAPAAFRKNLEKAGWVIAGQTPRLVPADRVLYALRDATATVESVPLIASSILSKKIAAGADALLMDVKVGRGAFLPTLRQARLLAETIVKLGNASGLKTHALLTDMDHPIGREIGNANEVHEAIDVLKGEGPADTRALTVTLGGHMLVLAGRAASVQEGENAITKVLGNGQAWEAFAKGVQLQGGDRKVLDEPARLPRARHSFTLEAAEDGFCTAVDARALGVAATLLGAGRSSKADKVDPAVGISLLAVAGDRIQRRQPLCRIWYNDEARLQSARNECKGAFEIGHNPPSRRRLVRGSIA